jgi:hypothetical protein
MLRTAGFSEKPAKGSPTKWLHPQYPGRITRSGKDGTDAKPYQEKAVDEAIKIVEQIGE